MGLAVPVCAGLAARNSHQIAVNNHHPHASAIHVACWLSVFTLHALWPLVYLWAIMPGAATGRGCEPRQ